MPFDLPAMSDSRDLLVALGKALFPSLNFENTRGYHGKWATFLSGAVTQLHFHVSSAQLDLHPLTAGPGKPIRDWGATVGVDEKGATPARKSAAGRVRGAAGATVDPGQQLRNPQTGLLFEIANSTTITIPGVAGVDPDSFVDADIAGVDTGSQTRLNAGATLNFLTAPVGIESEVKLQLDLDEDGFDDEQFGSYRARVLSTFSTTPSGGNTSDFVGWAKAALASVQAAYAYPNRAGRGTIDIVAFYAGSDSARSLSSPDRDSVLAYIKTKAPFQVSGEGGGLRVLETIPDPQRVEILVTTTGVLSFLFDWPDGGSPTVLAYTPSTRELQFSAPLPGGLRAGHRLVLVGTGSGSGMSAQDGREYKIESISASDKVILEKAPPTPPAATDLIYSGGPLVTPIRDAVVAHLNGEIVYAGRGPTPVPESKAAPTDPNGPSIIGLDVLAEGIGPANPVTDGVAKYGSWAGGIVLATLYRIATYKAGVRNISIVSPSVDYEAVDDAFPLDDQIHYVTPGVVIIRSS